MVEVHNAAAGFRRKPSCGQSLPASGSFEGPALWLDHAETGDPSLLGTCLPVPQRPCSCLSTFQHTARIGDVCHKLDIKFTIELDRALADRLNPARDDCQQIYKLLKAQKKPRSNRIAVMVGSSWFRGHATAITCI